MSDLGLRKRSIGPSDEEVEKLATEQPLVLLESRPLEALPIR